MISYTEASQRYHTRGYESSIYFTAERALGNEQEVDLPTEEHELLLFIVDGCREKARYATNKELFTFLYSLKQLKAKFEFDNDDVANAFIVALHKKGEELAGGNLFRYAVGVLKNSSVKKVSE